MEQVNILIMNHGRFGEELIKSAEMIVGKLDDARAISLLPEMSLEALMASAEQALSAAGDTVILTDLFGGTPCNAALALQQKYNVPVMSGLNLPILLEIASQREEAETMDDLLRAAAEAAGEGIRVFMPGRQEEAEGSFCEEDF